MPPVHPAAFLVARGVVVASDAQLMAMIAGGLAIRDAVVEACTRDGSLCTDAIATVGARFTAPSSGPHAGSTIHRNARPSRSGRGRLWEGRGDWR